MKQKTFKTNVRQLLEYIKKYIKNGTQVINIRKL
jgi:hypothetical protein